MSPYEFGAIWSGWCADAAAADAEAPALSRQSMPQCAGFSSTGARIGRPTATLPRVGPSMRGTDPEAPRDQHPVRGHGEAWQRTGSGAPHPFVADTLAALAERRPPGARAKARFPISARSRSTVRIAAAAPGTVAAARSRSAAVHRATADHPLCTAFGQHAAVRASLGLQSGLVHGRPRKPRPV